MPAVRPSVLILPLTFALGTLATAASAPPEIARPPGSTTAQAIGALHTLRTIPEACVRLEGLFTGDAAEPYRIEVLPREQCARRAIYIDAADLKQPPSLVDHWVLNDRIDVPRADLPACVATIDIWRRPGTAAPPALDAQGRARIYLDKPQVAVNLPGFSATLKWSPACKTAPKLSPASPAAPSPAAGS